MTRGRDPRIREDDRSGNVDDKRGEGDILPLSSSRMRGSRGMKMCRRGQEEGRE